MNTVTRERTLLNVSFKIRVHYTDAFHLHGRHKWQYVFGSTDRRPVMMSITASKVHACVYPTSHLGADLADWLHHPGELNGCCRVFMFSLRYHSRGEVLHIFCVRRSGCYYSFHQNRRRVAATHQRSSIFRSSAELIFFRKTPTHTCERKPILCGQR